jgi:LysR family nitrogen assimilation transcriptional regulator
MAQKYPLVKLSLQAALPDMVPYHLNSGKADLGITANTSPNIVYQGMPLFKETLHLIGPRESFLQEKSSITLQEVSELPLLLPMIEGSRKLFDQSFEKIGVKPKVVYEIDSPSTMLDLVKDNKGFAILSYAMVHRMVDDNEITNSIIVDPSIDRILYTSYPINRPQTLLCRVVEREIIDLVSINSYKAQWELIPNRPSNSL